MQIFNSGSECGSWDRENSIIWHIAVCHYYEMKNDTWSRHNASVHLIFRMCVCEWTIEGFYSLFVMFHSRFSLIRDVDRYFFSRMQPSYFYMYSLLLRSLAFIPLWIDVKETALLLLLFFTYNFLFWALTCTYAMIFSIFQIKVIVDVMVINSLTLDQQFSSNENLSNSMIFPKIISLYVFNMGEELRLD